MQVHEYFIYECRVCIYTNKYCPASYLPSSRRRKSKIAPVKQRLCVCVCVCVDGQLTVLRMAAITTGTTETAIASSSLLSRRPVTMALVEWLRSQLARPGRFIPLYRDLRLAILKSRTHAPVMPAHFDTLSGYLLVVYKNIPTSILLEDIAVRHLVCVRCQGNFSFSSYPFITCATTSGVFSTIFWGCPKLFNRMYCIFNYFN